MIGQVEKCIDFSDAHSLGRFADFHNFVARSHISFLQDAQIESGPSAGSQQCWHPRLVHSNAHAVAGDARLCNLEQGAADLVTVANAYISVRQSFDCEILAELAGYETSSPKPL